MLRTYFRRWIRARILATLGQLVLGALGVGLVVMLVYVATTAPLTLAVLVPLVLMAEFLIVFVLANVELWPWSWWTRYRLRRFEEATAQRSGHNTPLRSADLKTFGLGASRPSAGYRAIGYGWDHSGAELTPASARELPQRPEAWLAEVPTQPALWVRIIEARTKQLAIGAGAALALSLLLAIVLRAIGYR